VRACMQPPLAHQPVLQLAANRPWLCIIVSDSGTGMSTKEAVECFNAGQVRGRDGLPHCAWQARVQTI
jgi:hypothetical protein